MASITLLLLVSSCLAMSYGFERQFVCNMVDSSQENNRTVSGEHEQGNSGHFGRGLQQLSAKITLSLGQLLSQIQEMARSVSKLMSASATQCNEDGGFVYGSRCYKAILRDTRTIAYKQAKELCHDVFEKLADIKNLDQQLAIQSYVRSKRPAAETTYLYLGMHYYRPTRTLRSSTGQVTRNLHWYPKYPSTEDGHNKMLIDVLQQVNTTYQGIWNDQPRYNADGALCEKPL